MAQLRLFKNPILIKTISESTITEKEASAISSLPQKKLTDLQNLQDHLSSKTGFVSDPVKRKHDSIESVVSKLIEG
ncbi:9675_t:CDS:2 [Racocetra fulgida]|uniref:9675_t:CDS:1 n=1 Tax=Racocetra fulgida TaxID=60492 RepID=A0A9N9FQU2_9GLOM|nr:9675_t:CDS:2 [Racocetra fulgida]